MSTLDWAERERLVIEMLRKGQGISPKEIAHQLKMSLRDVYKIRDRHFGRNKEKELTPEHQATMLFLKDKNKKPPEVSLELRISLDEATRYYIKYKDSYYLGKFGQHYKYFKPYMKELAEICYSMKNGLIKVKDLIEEHHLSRNLVEMEERHLYLLRSIQDAEKRKETLQNDIQILESKLNLLGADIEASEHRLSLANEFLTYQNQNTGYNYYQNTYPNQQYNNRQNYFRYY